MLAALLLAEGSMGRGGFAGPDVEQDTPPSDANGMSITAATGNAVDGVTTPPASGAAGTAGVAAVGTVQNSPDTALPLASTNSASPPGSNAPPNANGIATADAPAVGAPSPTLTKTGAPWTGHRCVHMRV